MKRPNHPLRRHALSATIFALAAGYAATSLAQSTLEEINVTARRKVELVEDVPISMAVIGGDTLDTKGAFNGARLAELQPSIQYFASNPRNTGINIRGLGAPFGLTNDGIEPGVGVYIDQVYNARPASTSFDFIDVQQVEVLRGPQGTLYGKNTTAGAVNVTTRAPEFTPGGKLEVSYGDYGFQQTRGFLTGPITDDIAARISFSGTKRNGTVYDTKTSQFINNIDNLGVRGQVLFNVNSDFKLTLNADYNQQRPTCCVQVYASIAPTQRPLNRQFAAMASDLGYTLPTTTPYTRITDVDTPIQSHQDLGGLSLLAEWNLGGGKLTSVTAWRYWNWYPLNDRDFIGLPITTISSNFQKQTQWTQEIRFAGNITDKFDYVAGVFLYKQDINTDSVQEQGSAAARFLLAPSANANTPGLLNGLHQDSYIKYDNKSYALFSQATWHVTDNFSVVPGLRYNYDYKNADYNNVVVGGLQTTNAALIALKNSVLQSQAYHAISSNNNLSGEFTLQYKFADHINGYATYSKAYKSVGMNLNGIPADAAGNPALSTATVLPEKVHNYEVGVKSTLLNGSLSINADIFDTRIHDFQANVINGAVGVLRGYLANAEAASVKGGEIDVSWRPTSNLLFTLSGAFADGKYDDFKDAPCPLEQTGAPAGPLGAGVCDASGTKLPGIPDTVLTASGEYSAPGHVFGQNGEFFVGGDVNNRSDFSSSPTYSQYMVVNGYTITNARAGFRSSGKGDWQVFVWGRNLFNTKYYEFLTAQPGSTGLIVGQLGDPRTAGVTFNFSF
ncbi:MAG TPA: TonB-dependent receptor [Candidatus Acidoferrum sp.]|nr:TonB-dependent receptor [Candidatus Acidoferrum sp.]